MILGTDVLLLIVLGALVFYFVLSTILPPTFEHKWMKCIYAGFPGWFREDEDGCPTMAGAAAWLARVHYNGYVFTYTDSFWIAWFAWVRGRRT